VQLVQTVVLIRVITIVVVVLLDSTRLEKVGAVVELVPQVSKLDQIRKTQFKYGRTK
jgi:hypothetical protein